MTLLTLHGWRVKSVIHVKRTEKERVAKELERAAKEEERAAKEAALAEVAVLRERLRALGATAIEEGEPSV